MTHPARRIALDGAFNFRDLGGYRTRDGRSVRWRKLFRSDTLDFLTWEDVRVVRDNLGVHSVIDLRTPGELARRSVKSQFEPPAGRHVLPLIDDATMEEWNARPSSNRITSAESYKWMVDNARPQIVNALGILASTDGRAAVFHCFAGKDRTGVLSAILLSVLGVDDEAVAHDYSITAEVIEELRERSIALARDPELVRSLPPEAFETKPGVMLETLDHVRAKYGSVEDYVLSSGARRELLAQLRAAMLE